MNTEHDIDDTNDDTEGHAFKSGRAVRVGRDAGTADTEGHAIRAAKPGRDDGTDDTEGHMPRVRFVDDADEGDLVGEADTEGHALKSGRAAKVGRDGGTDDTEGHGARASHLDDADTEGHGFRAHRLDGADEGDLVRDADTEGHLYIPKDERAGGVEPEMIRGAGGLAPAGEDDTEGHIAKGRP